MPTLDPRAPFVLDAKELGRRAGTQKEVARSEQAPAGLGTDMIGVPEGSDVHLQLRLEAVVEGVLVTGSASVHVEGQCVRCLDDLHDDLVADVQELYVYDDAGAEADEDAEGVRLLEDDDLIDLEAVLRDAVVLALPLNPVCGPDCPGLCPECGVRLADDPDHAHEEPIDPRWAALGGLRLDEEPQQTVTTPGRRPGTETEEN